MDCQFLRLAPITALALLGAFFLSSPLFTAAKAQEETDPFTDPFALPGPGEEVDLELVLAVDISFSVDSFEARSQRQGYADAITHPSVLAAIDSGLLGKIAVTYVEWADSYHQAQLVDWTLISDKASAQVFAAQLEAAPLTRAFYTSISHAIDFSADLFDSNHFKSRRRVIDISGDGTHNQGRPLGDSRREALARGIVINGLPILNDRPQPVGIRTPKDLNLDLYYSDNVIGGPGAFIVIAEDFEDFRAAILSKLIREIAHTPYTYPADKRYAGK